VTLEQGTLPGAADTGPDMTARGTGTAVYAIEHDTRYVYDAAVSTSQHLACLRPRELPHQQVRSFDLLVEPAPAHIAERLDYFGNTVHQFQLLRPHIELRVIARSIVDVHPRESVTAEESPPWEEAQSALARPGGDTARTVAAFAYASPHVVRSPELARFARPSFTPGRPLLVAALDLMRRIHAEFVFDPSATTVATPVTRVLVDRRGVCQDFAHFQIACLRSLGLAARYVSGYLLTDPPPGQPRLIGADASHAWLSVHCPRHGWVDLDPTNNVLVVQRHVTIGWGRDYGDVSPLRGVLLGGAGHRLFVGVSVVPQGG
jgi:transglutaminase-like putative cysteine protease